MKVNYEYGPAVDDSEEYIVGPYRMNKMEAMELAYNIINHYRPSAVAGGGFNRIAQRAENILAHKDDDGGEKV